MPSNPDNTTANNDTTILIVDDEDAIRDMLCVLLEDEGYNVVTAADGLEAIDRLEESHPDLVVSDLMMPEDDQILLGENLAAISHLVDAGPE